jgi:heptosyltransferase-2
MYKKILISSPSGVGDSILFGPALQLLSESFPEAELHVLAMYKGSVDFFGRFPEVRCIHFWDYFNTPTSETIKFLLMLRKHRFDLVINAFPSNRAEYNLVAFVLGAKRAGHKYLTYNFGNLYFLNQFVVEQDASCHAAEENVRLVRAVGARAPVEAKRLLFPLTSEEKQGASEWLRARGLHEAQLLGIHPGCNTLKNHARRRWAPEKFAALGTLLFEQYALRPLIFGGADERDLMQVVADRIGPAAVLVHDLSLGQVAALIQHCRSFVSSDSGLMHVAAAVQTPCVPILGPTNPTFIRPYGSPHVVASRYLSCSPCFSYSPRPLSCKWGTFECIRDLSVEQAAASCRELLSIHAAAPLAPSKDPHGSIVAPMGL